MLADRQTPEQILILFRPSLHRCSVRYVQTHRRCECLLQSRLADLCEIAAQGRRGGLAMPQDCETEFGTRLPEEAEFAFTHLSAKPVHFLRDRQNVQTIEVFAGDRKPQNRKMPRAQYLLMSFGRSGIHCNAPTMTNRRYARAAVIGYSQAAPASARATCALLASSSSTIGNRVLRCINPSRLSACFKAAGPSFDRQASN